MNLGPDQVDLISARVSWAVRSLPMKYLCVPLHFSKLREETTCLMSIPKPLLFHQVPAMGHTDH